MVRALCKLPIGHSSGADFASAGNDGVIRLWTLRGRKPVAELYGHENFVYSIAASLDGEIVSTSEDRTARIWRDLQCVQTITHPAISVWTVAVCQENGDIVTGSSDNIIRVFSKDSTRQANLEAIQAFDASVKGSAIPQQQVGEINKEKLIARSDLPQRSGKHDGQIVMAREDDGSVTAHSWSVSGQGWVEVGTVVDATTSGKKVGYNGREYDYVFDVDIEDGKPPLKLPYNVTQNPYDAATRFINDNELPIGYLDQVVNFINTNTRGASIGETNTTPSGADPWGQESRYRPGNVEQATQAAPSISQVPPSKPSLPQQEFLSITNANLKIVVKKLEEFNQGFIPTRKDIALDSQQIDTLKQLTVQLEKSPSKLPAQQDELAAQSMAILLRIISSWPPPSRLPALDLLRVFVAASEIASGYGTSTSPYSGLDTMVDIFSTSGLGTDKNLPNHIMLAVRALANMFTQPSGRSSAEEQFDKIQQFLHPLLHDKTNRNLGVALSTVYVNYAVLFTNPNHLSHPQQPPHRQQQALTLLNNLSTLLQVWRTTDSEITYRSLVAIGTLLTLGDNVLKEAAKSDLDVFSSITSAASSSAEPRIKRITREIEEQLS